MPRSAHFSRDVAAVFSKLGCNSGGCHGAVNGGSGFATTLFGGNPTLSRAIATQVSGRHELPGSARSLLLPKATGDRAQEANAGDQQPDYNSCAGSLRARARYRTNAQTT